MITGEEFFSSISDQNQPSDIFYYLSLCFLCHGHDFEKGFLLFCSNINFWIHFHQFFHYTCCWEDITTKFWPRIVLRVADSSVCQSLLIQQHNGLQLHLNVQWFTTCRTRMWSETHPQQRGRKTPKWTLCYKNQCNQLSFIIYEQQTDI